MYKKETFCHNKTERQRYQQKIKPDPLLLQNLHRKTIAQFTSLI